MIEAVIFDMDGVLVDTEKFYLKSKQQVLQNLGVNVAMDYHYAFFGTSATYTWQSAKNEFMLELPVPDLIQMADSIRNDLIEQEGVTAIKDVQLVLDYLKKQGKRISLASSSPMSTIRHHLHTVGFADYFEIIESGENVVQSKPAPDIFLSVSEQMRVKPENCIVIEDSQNGVKAAIAAGMKCIGFRNPDYPPQDLSEATQIQNSMREIKIELANNL